MMEAIELSLTRYFVTMLLLQMVTPSSEQFTVTGLQKLKLASLGEAVELSCQLSPPQSAEHMEIRWFRDRYTQPVHLYSNGKDLHGETVSRYVERTELLKGAIGEGKVTLQIFNVSVDDDGQYHCFFKDGDFYEEAITEVKVTATSLRIEILVHHPNSRGVLVECNSEGWFPEPQMEWRDSRGKVIAPASKSHSQGTDKLFNMKMTLLLRQAMDKNITCCLQNPVTGQEERTSIVLADQFFPWNTIWILTLGIILCLMLIIIMVPSFDLHNRLKDFVCKTRAPITVGILIIMATVVINASLISYLHHKSRVPPSDPHFQLDTMWLEDMTVILCVLTVFITTIISFIYFRFRGFLQR